MVVILLVLLSYNTVLDLFVRIIIYPYSPKVNTEMFSNLLAVLFKLF